jgi:ribose transport system ATP-binding protein
MQTIPPLLTMKGVCKRFGSTLALRGVDLQLCAGEVHAVVGENGAGKSTLMKVLSGAHTADSGEMTLDGQPYRPPGPMAARRAGVSMIYQELAVAPDLTVMENILLGVEPGRRWTVNWRQMRHQATAALAQLGLADLPVDRRLGDLSPAERQMVEIARSVATGCKVLVLDEPTSSLARADVQKLFVMLRRLRDGGIGILYISHFLEELREICTRFTVIRDGMSTGTGLISQTTNEQIVRLMVGRDVKELYPRSPRTAGEVVLQLDQLAGIAKPAHASLALRRGEVLGVFGLVGAGRTEMLRAVFGLDPVKSGRVKVASTAGISRVSPAARWAQGVGMVSEDRKAEGLALGLSIADNIGLSSLRPLVSPAAQQHTARRWIDRLGIRCASPAQAVGDLSGGNQQKVAIARLLRHGVDVLLLDEPTRGVDIAAKAQIYRLIDELVSPQPDSAQAQATHPEATRPATTRPAAILIVSSYLPELMGICDRIAVMTRGVLGEPRAVADLDEHALIAEAVGATV